MKMSEQSQSIAKLAAAMNAAQAEIGNALRDSENPFFKSHYADLASVREAYQPAFTKHGLALVQMPYAKDGRVGVETMLMHSSGEWIKAGADVKPVKDDPQSYGSAVTYLRRYSAAAFAGLATEDDDGEGAQGRGEKPAARPPQKTPEPQPKPETKPDPKQAGADGSFHSVTGRYDKVFVKTGTGARGAWSKSSVKIGEQWFSTFDTAVAESLKAAKDTHVELRYKTDAKGFHTVVEVLAAPAEPESVEGAEPEEDNIPF
jgi:hypothetical protein